MRSLVIPSLVLMLLAAVTGRAGAQSTYVIGGPTRALSPSSPFAWDDPALQGLRQALRAPANFGVSGTVPVVVTPMDLSTVDDVALGELDCFVAPGWSDFDVTDAQVDAIVEFFVAGGDLLLFSDSVIADRIAEELGLESGVNGAVAVQGMAPFFRGPFGTAAAVQLQAPFGNLSSSDALNLGGEVAAVTSTGQTMAVRFNRGAYGPRCGALVIIGDADCVTTNLAQYAPLNDNGRFALNVVAFLAAREKVSVWGGPDASLTPGTPLAQSWQGADLAPLRAAWTDPALFGGQGTVPHRVYLEDLAAVDFATLIQLSGLVVPNWLDVDLPSLAVSDILKAAQVGVDLCVISERPDAAGVITTLGIPVTPDPSPPTFNTLPPMSRGPFGNPPQLSTEGSVLRFNSNDVALSGGTMIAFNLNQAVGAYYSPGSRGRFSGRILVLGDPGILRLASFTSPNDNGRAVLNCLAALLEERRLEIGGIGDWDGQGMLDLRSILENPGFFGMQALGKGPIRCSDLLNLDPLTLAPLDVLVVDQVANASLSPDDQQAILQHLSVGGGLWLLQGTDQQDLLSTTLGLPATNSSAIRSSVQEPLDSGPYGPVSTIDYSLPTTSLSPGQVQAVGADAAAINSIGGVYIATLAAGQYLPGHGPLMVQGGDSLFLASDYSAMNDEARFGLNCVDWLLRDAVRIPTTGYGASTPGKGGFHPRLQVVGSGAGNTFLRLDVRHGVGGASCMLVVGTSGRLAVPFKSCQLLVNFPWFTATQVLGGPAGAAGRGSRFFLAKLPPALQDVTVQMQVFVFDAAGPQGIACSRGLEMELF